VVGLPGIGARLPSESVGGLDRNQCPGWAGISGRIAPEYAGKSKSKVLALSTREFMRRFLMHVLPRGLVRIRHYGFLGSSAKKKSLAAARSLIPKSSSADDSESKATEDGIAEFLAKAAVIGERQCPHCKNGRLVKIDIIP